MDIYQLRKKFNEAFTTDSDGVEIFFSPGRLCLIGEHIDYNGGLVLPAAISSGIWGLFRRNGSRVLKLRSGIDEREVSLRLDDEIIYDEKRKWANYPAGVIRLLKQKGVPVPGGELYFESNLPQGAGLSSSAAIEVLTGFIFSTLCGNLIDRITLAQLGKQAENEFVGVQCGIMDQFAVALGKAHHAIMLHCSTLAHEYVPMNTGDYRIVIFNTNKKRALTDSLFNQRVSECGEALRSVQRHQQIASLAEAEEDAVHAYVANPVSRKRALHVVQENKRVKQAAEALRKGDLKKFGSLLFLSHRSLKEQYEVTGPELDAIEEAARTHPACIGAKMSGAGFGGCAFALVEKEALRDFTTHVLNRYHLKTGLTAGFYIAAIGDGVKKIY